MVILDSKLSFPIISLMNLSCMSSLLGLSLIDHHYRVLTVDPAEDIIMSYCPPQTFKLTKQARK